jgi:hypothetical protein
VITEAARGFAPLRGCFRKGSTDSSLRASSGYARKGKSHPFRPSLQRKTKIAHRVACIVTTEAFHLAESKDS